MARATFEEDILWCMFGAWWTWKEWTEQVLYHMWFRFMQALHLYQQTQWSWPAKDLSTCLQRSCSSRADGEVYWL